MSDTPITKNILSICDEAMARTSGEREAFISRACGDNTQLRDSVESVLRAITAAGHFLTPDDDLVLPEQDIVGSVIGSYRIVDKLGEGGMGAVFLAEREQEDYTQRVALKMIRGRFLANELVERFNAERKILAGLNHPYIAALIDGGTTPDGMPYLVMEYIEGLPLDAYCDKHSLGVKERVKLIQKIAMAAQSAHQNLVVHRDLKPSNVLITADGIPKLLDFGIAKLIQADPDEEGDDSGSTAMYGRQAMTPDFASPEQILENKVTTASDVYSLGILTYSLLAGERPYRLSSTSRRDMIRSVEELTVPRASTRLEAVKSAPEVAKIAASRGTTPQRLKKLLAGDIDNILLKALHKDAERRYVSVAAFSADLDRYLKGLPVEARPDSIGYRTHRFISRNKVAVSASVALAFTVVAALAISSWAYFRAETARAEATQRFDQVRSIANVMMFDVFDEVTKLDGATKARELLAESAQSYLNSLATSTQVTQDIRFDAGKGYIRLARAQGGIDHLSLGNRNTATQNYQRARDMLTALHEEYPENFDYAMALAELQQDLAAHALYSDNDIPQARELAELSIRTYSATQPRTDAVIIGHVSAMTELADTYDWEGDPAASAEVLRAAIDLIAQIDTNPAINARAASTKAKVLRDLGSVEYYLDDFESSLAHLQDSRDLIREILRHTDNRPVIERGLAITLFELSGTQVDGGWKEESLVSIDEAVAIANSLFTANPNDTGALQLISAVVEQRATILSELGRFDEAITQAKESYNFSVMMSERSSDDAMSNRGIMIDTWNVGRVYFTAGRNGEACEWLTRAVDLLHASQKNETITGFDENTLLPEVKEKHKQACK